jgi:diguanylate cyclase (GGDEF)-like protein
MNELTYQPQMLAAALLMALFAAHVALEVALRLRGGDPLVVLGWLIGGSLSVGTGLWAMNTLGLLSLQPGGVVGHDSALSLASWLLGVGAVFVLLWGAGRSERRWSDLAIGGGAFALALTAMFLLGAMALQLTPPLISAPLVGMLAIVVTSLIGALFVLALGDGKLLQAVQSPLRRAAALAAATVALISAMFLAGGFAEMPARAATTALLPSDSLAVLAGLGATVLLSMALLMAKLELRLSGKTARLAESLRQANEDLQKIAFNDPLTQLPNRLVFEERLERAVSRADRDSSRLALLFIDLDGFKPINDSFGHSSGDIMLREVGSRLRSLARHGDTMARVGGDEFLMLLEGQPDEGSAALVAQRVLKTLSQPVTIGDRDVAVSCSIGIVFHPDGAAPDKLIAHADAAMYAAKRAGGSTYCFFEPSMDADAREQVEMLRDLRSALEHKQFELHYQPKIDAKSGQITAAEALLRWRHPVRGLVGPGTFIPIAERFGLIGNIGNWVIEEVCRQAREWRDKGLRMRVAMNLSVHQMRQDDLVDRIQGALKRHRIDPSLLTCEITESVAMEDTRATQAAFKGLGRAGVHLSIDDFGTGYSSLAYLRQLPAEEVKIDRSFVQDVATSADARAIVDAVVRLTHALGKKVVAEGVENEQQREILLQLGCDELQGFLFAKPMSARALLLWAIDDRPAGMAGEFRQSLFEETRPASARHTAFPNTQPLIR